MSRVKEKQARRRTEIIKSVISLITSEDFDKINVTDLCRAAGISIGTFYHYFTQKSDMLIGLLWIIDEDMEENVFPLMTHDDEMENLRIFARNWAEHINANGLVRSKLISTINPEGEGLLEKERTSVQRIRQLFKAAIQKEQVSEGYSAETLTDYFFLLLRSVSTDWSRRDGKYDIVKKMDEMTEFFIDGCRK